MDEATNKRLAGIEEKLARLQESQEGIKLMDTRNHGNFKDLRKDVTNVAARMDSMGSFEKLIALMGQKMEHMEQTFVAAIERQREADEARHTTLVETLKDKVSISRFVIVEKGFFGAIALILAAVGGAVLKTVVM